MADELEKMQRALNQSFSDRDRIGSELDKYRDDLERSQVCTSKLISIFQAFYPNILWQAASGKYQIQVEKAQTQLDKTQSDFDRMQEKFERSQNEIRKVSHVCFQCIF